VPKKPHLLIVTPYLADANNGNWRTASRWAKQLSSSYRITLAKSYEGQHVDGLLALHARRSGDSVSRFAVDHPRSPLIVALTGTDLYKDIPVSNQTALQSLNLATRLIALQEDAPRFVPTHHQHKVDVVFQSAHPFAHLARLRSSPEEPLKLIAVGHLRDEKDPLTLMKAFALLPRQAPVRLTHVGAALDERIGKAAQQLAARDSRYRWIAGLAHGLTRIAIARSHALIHPSIMEGGAQVVIEAMQCGTPVIASEMSGNVGLLGSAYGGYFPVGDAKQLAQRIMDLVDRPGLLNELRAQCDRRAKLCTPAAEERALKRSLKAAFGLV
jgi:putative glycosyltransferase (TIGR04348 family)